MLVPLVLLVIVTACGAPSAGTSSAPPAARASAASPMRSASGLVLVVTDEWGSPTGTIALFERSDGGWESLFGPTPAVVGRSGLGWGVGLHGAGAPAGRSGPEKREGDGRAPAGIFALGAGFGYAEAPPSAARIEYRQSTVSVQCVDDGSSAHYNRVIDTSTTESDWSSAERLLRDDPLYERLILVGHNTAPPQAGYGSCIFLHVWRQPDRGTDGCYATSLEHVEAVMAAMDPERTVLVALPRSELDEFRGAWGLP